MPAPDPGPVRPGSPLPTRLRLRASRGLRVGSHPQARTVVCCVGRVGSVRDCSWVLSWCWWWRWLECSSWAPAALVKISILGALQHNAEAELLAAQVQKSVTDVETARAAQLALLSGLIAKQDFERASKICDAAIKESTRPEILALAWSRKGDLFTAQRKWDDALLAYLHVAVFFPDEKSFIPGALLGSARAYRRLDETERAKKSLNELIATFPKSAEAAAALSIGADEIGIAELADRGGAILLSPGPEIAAGKAAEHRRAPGLSAFARAG